MLEWCEDDWLFWYGVVVCIDVLGEMYGVM